jgi:hypothetical protein
MAELSPEAAKLLAARKAAVAELKQIDGADRPISDPDVIRVSNARLLVDALMLRMLSGEVVGPGDLRTANAMVDAALDAARKGLAGGQARIRRRYSRSLSEVQCHQ